MKADVQTEPPWNRDENMIRWLALIHLDLCDTFQGIGWRLWAASALGNESCSHAEKMQWVKSQLDLETVLYSPWVQMLQPFWMIQQRPKAWVQLEQTNKISEWLRRQQPHHWFAKEAGASFSWDNGKYGHGSKLLMVKPCEVICSKSQSGDPLGTPTR